MTPSPYPYLIEIDYGGGVIVEALIRTSKSGKRRYLNTRITGRYPGWEEMVADEQTSVEDALQHYAYLGITSRGAIRWRRIRPISADRAAIPWCEHGCPVGASRDRSARRDRDNLGFTAL
jgi:hypothetical protein